MENTNIEWATHTWNPWIGCTRVSQGCVNCYAEHMMDERFKRVKWGPRQPRERTSEAYWKKPLAWNRKAAKDKTRARVFCASLADVFDAEVDQAWQNDLWDLVVQTPNLDWLLLTKRPLNIGEMVPESWMTGEWPANVWLGTSVENQEEAYERIPELLQYPAPVRFLSCEPLLGPVDLSIGDSSVLSCLGAKIDGECCELSHIMGECFSGIDWVIVGGESGPNARPMHPDWAERLRDQCIGAGTAFFFKQWGKWAPWHTVSLDKGMDFSGREREFRIHITGDGEVHGNPHLPGSYTMYALGKRESGRLLGGGIYHNFPTPKSRPGNLYVGPGQ